VPGILIDVDIEGHAERIWMHMQTEGWREFTTSLDIVFHKFRDVGLDPGTPDHLVWRFCQSKRWYLLTSNRNQESEEALEATIRREGTPDSLPVFTLPLPDRVYDSPVFLERVVDKLFNLILYAENVLGAGRLYLP
jgi:hypothetical protein